jgi:flagellar biogenesis protein FliO
MRFLGTFLAALVGTGLAVAGEGPLGTRSDTVSTSFSNSSTGGAMPLVQMGIALAIVYGLLKWALPRLAGKVGKKLVTNINGGIKVEESASFAGGSLYVVHARKKTLLLCVGTQGVQCLADLTEPDPMDSKQTFREMVEEAEQGETSPELALALSRIDRFTA